MPVETHLDETVGVANGGADVKREVRAKTIEVCGMEKNEVAVAYPRNDVSEPRKYPESQLKRQQEPTTLP